MSKENIVIGVGAAVAAGLGFVAYRHFKKKFHTKVIPQLANDALITALKNSTPAERGHILRKFGIDPNSQAAADLIAKIGPVRQTPELKVVETKPVETTPVEIEVKDDVPVVEEPVKEEVEPEPEVEDELAQALKHNAKAAADVVQTARVGNEEIHCVSRIRVSDNNNAPLFWNSMIRKIRRQEVVEISQEDFVGKDKEFPRGFHRCTLDGMGGILHVTRNNYSAVVIDEDGEFYGISTSVNRFGGRTLCNITADRARTFLNGN